MSKLVQKDSAVGLDESSCRMLMPKEIPEAKPGDLKTKRLIEKVQKRRPRGKTVSLERCGLTEDWIERRTTSSIFGFLVIAMARMTSSAIVSASYKEIVFREIHR